jgi:CheY-like chemotaxis protein
MSEKIILLVDDSRVARMLTRHAVEKAHADWVIVEAENGEEALALAAAQHPDFALVDVNMPGIDGLSAARQLRQQCPGTKISLLTANIQEPIRLQAAQCGIGFMAKPLKDEMLAEFLGDARP